MRRNSNLFLQKQFKPALFVLVLIIAGCSLEKKSALNRGLQNLTAHYNILFNAKEILKEKEEGYAAGFVDNYSELLSVYQDTAATGAAPDKDLEAAKAKANTIISVKEQSHYIPDAYLVLGKANYLAANYFDAVEYFNYVVLTGRPKQTDIKQEALVWKGRALLFLHKDAEAKQVIDSAIQNINPKKSITADVYAAKLQYDINIGEYADAEAMAKEAIKYSSHNLQRMRWTFILGQLQELNSKPADAVLSYARVAKSNVSFDMAFNADLNRIRIEDSQNGVKISRLARLRALLKNQNNADFTDQIYYQIAQLQYADNQIDDAIKSYKQSANYSTRNQNQKGLSYLRLADTYFKNKADYTLAKNYYDSTLATLLPNYPGYRTIQKKAENLQLLTDNLKVIAREDTLQMLAALDEPSREKRLDEMAKRQEIKKQTAAAVNNGASGSSADPFGDTPAPVASVPNGGNFYFYNTNAVSQGFSDFKRVWGNRKLEDNWRRSGRSNADLTTNTLNTAKNVDTNALPDSLQRSPGEVDANNFKQDLVQNLPLTPPLLAQSNMKRYDAYLAIANFYRDVLDDKKEAAAAYEKVLALFPNNDNKAAIYYNLYRLYSESNVALSDKYKALVLKEYPETAFAKTILDPDYGKRLNDEDTGFSALYNQVYDLYAAKKYTAVITSADGLLKTYPNNKYASQLEYLKAFAGGHQERLDPFKADLQQITAKYPDDQLITPLVKQHLSYIDVNQTELAARSVVITDRDIADGTFTIPIVYQQQTEYRVPYTGGPIVIVPDVRKPEKKPVPVPVVTNQPLPPPVKQQETVPPVVVQQPIKEPEVVKTKPEPVKEPEVAQTKPDPITQTQPEVTQAAPPVQAPVPTITPPVVKKPSIFNMRDSTNYYFVVAVNSGTTNLASSRFGIGQFNRVQYQGSPINHNLRNAGADNQLIYVGRFVSLENVKDYARRIVPLLPDIMKTPKDKYSFFIITKENLDKLADGKTLDSYIEYYQQNY